VAVLIAKSPNKLALGDNKPPFCIPLDEKSEVIFIKAPVDEFLLSTRFTAPDEALVFVILFQ
jgi:hypothetical protein